MSTLSINADMNIYTKNYLAIKHQTSAAKSEDHVCPMSSQCTRSLSSNSNCCESKMATTAQSRITVCSYSVTAVKGFPPNMTPSIIHGKDKLAWPVSCELLKSY